MSPVQRVGGRKFVLGVLYLLGCFGVSAGAIFTGATGWDAVGLASLPVAIASGLWTIVWGNVQEHRARSGGSD